jgi:hypothetical protein
MESCKPVKTPFEVKPCREVENGQDCIVELKPYRELIGCLMYVMLTTRPDLNAAVNFFSRFQINATDAQWFGLKRVLRYVQGTIDLGLCYNKGYDVALTGYADSDWAGDTDRRSTTGYLFEVYGATVSWVTKKQSTVSLSSTEAEYVALATAAAELIWMKRLLQEMGVIFSGPVIMNEDNQSFVRQVGTSSS